MSKKRLHVKHKDYHHRKPRSIGKPECCEIHDNENISHVNISSHRSWHQLFGNMAASEVAKLITKIWLDPDYYFVCIPRKKTPRAKAVIKVLHEDAECKVTSREKS